MSQSIEMSEASQAQNSMLTELPLMSSQAVSHARTSALLAREPVWAQKPDPASGQRLSGWLARYDPDTSSLRMSQTCLLAQIESLDNGSERCSGTWPRSGTMRSGTVFERVALDDPKREIVSGLWPTPRASMFLKWYARDQYVGNLEEHGPLRVTMSLAGKPINLNWLEWLMGFPIGHTAVRFWETR